MAEKEKNLKNKEKKLPFYLRKGPVVLCKIAGAASGIMVLASPFFSWRTALVHSDMWIRDGVSLFDVIRQVFSKNFHGKATTQVGLAALLLLILASGAMILFIVWRDQFRPGSAKLSSLPPDRFISSFRPVSRALPPVVSITAAIILSHTGTWNTLISKVDSTYTSWKSLISGAVKTNGSSGWMFAWKLPGLGCFLLFTGLALYIFAEIYRYIINTLNEED